MKIKVYCEKCDGCGIYIDNEYEDETGFRECEICNGLGYIEKEFYDKKDIDRAYRCGYLDGSKC